MKRKTKRPSIEKQRSKNLGGMPYKPGSRGLFEYARSEVKRLRSQGPPLSRGGKSEYEYWETLKNWEQKVEMGTQQTALVSEDQIPCPRCNIPMMKIAQDSEYNYTHAGIIFCDNQKCILFGLAYKQPIRQVKLELVGKAAKEVTTTTKAHWTIDELV